MSNQQEVKIIYYFNILRDYTRRVFQLERLRYSPTNSKNIYLYLNTLKRYFKNKWINVRLNKLYNLSIINNNYSTHFCLCFTLLPNAYGAEAKDPLAECQQGRGKSKWNKNISTHLETVEINPNWITGFVDAEGCFSVIIEILDNLKWRVRTSFEIYLHIKDVDILYKIQSFFGVGNVYLRAYKNIAVYRVSNIEYLRDIIIPHFNNYPLITQKSIDFNLWCKVIQIILNKEHLNNKGFLTILTYYASINRGISKKVLKYYPNIKPVSRSSINLPNNLNPFWVSGFVSLNPYNYQKICLKCRLNVQNIWSATPENIVPLNPVIWEKNKKRNIVVWGSNLSSTVGVHMTPIQLNMINFPSHIYGIIIGLILSDGWIRYGSLRSKNPLLGFLQSYKNLEYLLFVFSILSHYCKSYPVFRARNRLGKINYSLGFYTRSLPCLTEIYYLFYVNRVKVIPDNIYDLLTPEALAHWIMGDGTTDHGYGLIICTDSYSIQDIIKLMNVLMIKYRLNCKLRKHGIHYRIYIQKRSIYLLKSIVIPHMHSSMLYKIK